MDSRASLPLPVPSQGFPVIETLAQYGGADAIDQECRGCEANASSGQGPDVAGCHGDLLLDPWSRDLNVELRRRASALGLDDDMRQVFPETNSLWFGFWINTRLSERQCRLLRALLGEPELPDDGWSDDNDLEELLGKESWKQFVRHYLATQGHSAAVIDEIMDVRDHGP